VVVPSRRRLVVSWGSCSTLCSVVLFLFFFFSASVYCVYKHSLQLSTKSNSKLILVVLRLNYRCLWVSQTVMCVYTVAKHMTTVFLCKRRRSRNTKQPLNKKKMHYANPWCKICSYNNWNNRLPSYLNHIF
jgi:hypothetical protein